MRDNPINALRETLRCGFAFRKSRLESLCVLVFGVFVARTVNLSHLACHFPGRARSSSNYRRLQRFFEQVDFDYDRLAEFLVAMMGLQAGPWRLTMDRTNWRLGRRDVNILMIGIVNRAIAIPVCWRVLDKAGNSNTKERIAILEHVLRLFGVDKIASLLADREFIGDAWLAWLQEKAIPFHIRIRSNIKIANTRGRMVKARELFRDLKPGESRILSNARRLSEARKPKARPVFVAALHLKTGELLIVVTNDAPEEALAIYAQRWQIETLFAALKTRGFNLEDTHMTDPERISKLTAVLSITFCWAHKVGDWLHEAEPIRLKTHKRMAKSIFRYGFEWIRRQLVNPIDRRQAIELIRFLVPGKPPVQGAQAKASLNESCTVEIGNCPRKSGPRKSVDRTPVLTQRNE